jgi:hypothetical protein
VAERVEAVAVEALEAPIATGSAATRTRGAYFAIALLIAATAALCGAALGRVVPGNTLQYLLLWLAPILAMIGVDLVTRWRVHFVPVISAALLVVAFFKVPLYAAPPWCDVRTALLRPFV